VVGYLVRGAVSMELFTLLRSLDILASGTVAYEYTHRSKDWSEKVTVIAMQRTQTRSKVRKESSEVV
jgi:hypothetical protein